MSPKRDRFDKVLAVAINPGAYEAEALTALRKARDLVKEDPSLAYPPGVPTTKLASPGDTSFQTKITNVSLFWLPIIMSNLSAQGYGLGLKSKIVTAFSKASYEVDVRCDGPSEACKAFQIHLDWLVNYVNSQVRKKSDS
jgi:hypothetical protein